jgi:hypothetical protein
MFLWIGGINKTEVFDLPFKVIFDTYKGHLTIIEVNREPLQEAVIKNISFQFERNFPLPPVHPYFLNSASNHNFGGIRKIPDGGIDRLTPFDRQTVCVFECGSSQSLEFLHQRRLVVFQGEHVLIYIFVKIYGRTSSVSVNRIAPRRMVCCLYRRNSTSDNIPDYPMSVWSFGIEPLRVQEIRVISSWGFNPDEIRGYIENRAGIEPPHEAGQEEYMIDIPAYQLWSEPPSIPDDLPDVRIDLYLVLRSLSGLR